MLHQHFRSVSGQSNRSLNSYFHTCSSSHRLCLRISHLSKHETGMILSTVNAQYYSFNADSICIRFVQRSRYMTCTIPKHAQLSNFLDKQQVITAGACMACFSEPKVRCLHGCSLILCQNVLTGQKSYLYSGITCISMFIMTARTQKSGDLATLDVRISNQCKMSLLIKRDWHA